MFNTEFFNAESRPIIQSSTQKSIASKRSNVHLLFLDEEIVLNNIDAPTPEPSFAPTEDPYASELSPTLTPTEGNEWVPTTQPTENIPQNQPSSRPTLSSALPTFQPTDAPTFSSTELSESIPTSNPTVRISTFYPTEVPLFQPTGRPTMRPTISTETPTVEPTLMPTFSTETPTTTVFSPTPIPTAVPSFAPTTGPTYPPTDTPTFSPTTEPSFPPTASPTTQPSAWIVSRCTKSNTTSQILNYLDTTTGTVGLFDSNVNASSGRFASSMFNFTVTLRKYNLNNYPTSLVLQAARAGCSSLTDSAATVDYKAVRYTCSDSQPLNLIWLSTMSNRAFRVVCNNVQWVSNVCDDSMYRICANCTNPCATGFSFGFGNPAVSSSLFAVRWAAVLAFQTQTYRSSWPTWTQQAVGGAFNATVHYNVSFPGSITCAAVSSAVIISSSASVSVVSNAVTVSVNAVSGLVGSLVIGGLLSDTAYSVYCFTKNEQVSTFAQQTATIQYILQTVNYIRTEVSPLPALTVLLTTSSLVLNEVSRAVTVTLKFPVSTNATVVPYLRYIDDDLCTSDVLGELSISNDTRSFAGLYEGLQDAVILPNELYFGAYDVGPKEIYIKPQRAGCYDLDFDYVTNNGRVRVDADILVGQSTNLIQPGAHQYLAAPSLALNCTVSPLVPNIRLLSAVFSVSGLEIDITFSGPVDLGSQMRYASSFPCDLVLDFAVAKDSLCLFSSSTLLRVFPPVVGPDLPVVHDTISFLGGVLKPACDSTDVSFCELFDYIEAKEVTLSYKGSIVVSPALSLADISNVGSNVTLDLTTSTGNGGRGWLYNWQVTVNGSADVIVARRLQAFLNSGVMKWVGCSPQTLFCDTIPGEFFNSSGVYTFYVTLENFAGVSASTASTITVTGAQYVPVVRIVGSSFLTVMRNDTISLRAVLDSSAEQCNVPLEITWLSYMDDEATPFLRRGSSYKDPRSFIISGNVLDANHLYRFQVNVFCGSDFSYAQVERYVLSNEVVSVFESDVQSTVSLEYPLTFNGSLGQSMEFYGADDFQFQWTCLQISPLLSSGCDAFNRHLNTTNTAALTFSTPSSVFVPAATYLISLQITSVLLGYSNTIRQQITTLSSDSIMKAPQMSVTVPTLYVSNQFGYVINATVQADSTFVAEWQIVSTNETIATRSFINGGSQFFPAVIPARMLASRYSFQFRLSAFLPVSDCASLACMSASRVVQTTFAAVVNRPPAYGSMQAIPSVGDEDTMFSIYAYNWQDSDLPLFYEFQQSTELHGNHFQLVRQRMQLSFLRSKLVLSSTLALGNETMVRFKCVVSDVYAATSTAFASVTFASSRDSWNVTSFIDAAVDTLTDASRLLAPELVLPDSAGVTDALAQLDCYHIDVAVDVESGKVDVCTALVSSGAQSLYNAAQYYNVGFGLLVGLADYLEAFVAVSVASPVVDVDVVNTLLALYGYVQQSIAKVGFSRGNGLSIIHSLLIVSDDFVHLLEASTIPDMDAIYVQQLQAAVNTLAATYFSYAPFGVNEDFSMEFFNVTLRKGYLTQYEHSNLIAVDDNTGLHLAENSVVSLNDVTFTSSVFPSNSTTSFEILRVANSLPITTCNISMVNSVFNRSNFTSKNVSRCEQLTGTQKIIFRVFVSQLTSEALMTSHFSVERDLLQYVNTTLLPSTETALVKALSSAHSHAPVFQTTSHGHSFSNETVANNRTMTNHSASDIVVLYRNCSSDAVVVNGRRVLQDVTCTSEETGAAPYVFPDYVCAPQNSSHYEIVNFTCPRYRVELMCMKDGIAYARAALDNSTFGTLGAGGSNSSRLLLSCTYPLLSSQATQRMLLGNTDDAISTFGQDSGDEAVTTVNHAVTIEGIYSVGKVTFIVSSAAVQAQPVDRSSNSGSASLVSDNQEVSYIAIVAIVVSGILFAGFMYYRVKHFVAHNPTEVTTILPTQAELVPSRPWTVAEIIGEDHDSESGVPSTASSASTNDEQEHLEEGGGIRVSCSSVSSSGDSSSATGSAVSDHTHHSLSATAIATAIDQTQSSSSSDDTAGISSAFLVADTQVVSSYSASSNNNQRRGGESLLSRVRFSPLPSSNNSRNSSDGSSSAPVATTASAASRTLSTAARQPSLASRQSTIPRPTSSASRFSLSPFENHARQRRQHPARYAPLPILPPNSAQRPVNRPTSRVSSGSSSSQDGRSNIVTSLGASGGQERPAVPVVADVQVEMIHIDAVAMPYLRL